MGEFNYFERYEVVVLRSKMMVTRYCVTMDTVLLVVLVSCVLLIIGLVSCVDISPWTQDWYYV